MSKAGKRVKSGQGQQGGSKWEQALLSAPFEEEKWKANVTFVVGHQVEDDSHITILSSAVAAGTRKLFSTIGKDELYNEVRDLGNPKAKKGKEIPQHYEVCEPCKIYLDSGEDIPLPLLARLLKFKLLAIKAADLKRREAERKASTDKDKGGKKDKKDRAKSPKKGGKKTPEPQAAKEGSKLRKRGDEDTESKYLDDEPDDGAQHYVIIHGFHNAHIFGQLAEVGVNVDCVIRVSSQEYMLEEPLADLSDKDEKTQIQEELLRAEKRKHRADLKQFWKDLLLVLQRNADSSRLHDIPRVDYEVQSLLIPQNLEDNDQRTTFGAAMFEDIAVMMYDLLDARRLYSTYLENIKLIHVPLYGQPPAPPPGQDAQSSGTNTPGAQGAQTSQTSVVAPDQTEQTPPVDMRYYNDLMNCVPQESVSVPLIMHCMLEQVEASEQNKDPPSEQLPPPRTDGLNAMLATHLSEVAFKLALTETEHQELSDVFDLPERPPDMPRQPLLMNSKDDITMRTHHLETIYGFNPLETEKEMLKHLTQAQLRNLPRPTSGVMRERAARLQELIHFCATGAMSPSEIDRAFKQFVFESMDLASTDSNGFIITRDSEGMEHSAIPWDDPYPYYKGMIPHHEKAQTPKVPYNPSPSDEERSGARSPTPDDRSVSVVDFSGDVTDSGRKEGETSPTRSRASSADSKKGILRPPSRAASPEKPKSRSNSVHFEIDDEGRPVPPHVSGMEDEGEGEPRGEDREEQSVEDSIKEIVEAQKRVLDQWCFAEHFEAPILLQVMKEAAYCLPFMDLYYHKRDHSLLVCHHNPYSHELQNHVDWHTELHSNMGFRNYLEYTAESVADWLKEKEAEYQAHLLSREVDKIREDEEAVAKAAEKAAKGNKSPKQRTRSKSPKGSRASSQERPTSASSNPFIRAGSLKAWKEEQDRIKAEEEEKERVKSEKRSKSPRKKQEEDKEKEEKDKKRPGSRGSAKSKSSQKESHEPVEPLPPAEPEKEEQYWPYTGYDVGNSLIHVSGIVTSMFPSDGGQIRTERTEFVQGTTCVRTCVLKDNHVICVHILDPKESLDDKEDEETCRDGEEKKDLPEKAELEKSEKEEGGKRGEEGETAPESVKKSVSAFGSITATLSDGMTLALSHFGESGESKDGKRYEPEVYVPPVISTSPLPQASKDSPTKGKRDKGKGAPTPDPPQTQQSPSDDDVVAEVAKEEESIAPQPFQQLYITCPDGLHVTYFLESHVGVKPNSPDERHLVVKQSYPFKTKGSQPCESTRKKYALSEQSRIITSDGTVIKTMMDGTVEVLHADGTVHKHTGTYPLPSSRSSSPQRAGSARSGVEVETPTKKTNRSTGKPSGKSLSPDKLGEHLLAEDTSKKGSWVTTYPGGERMAIHSDGSVEELQPVMLCVASDPETRQSMSTRDDHVITVNYPDGTTIVEHSDGTRIMTYYKESKVPVAEDDEIETGEAPQLERQQVRFVKVECPAYATVQFNCSTSENLTAFGSGTNINVFADGFYVLHHCEGGRIEVDTEGTMMYFPRPNKSMEQILPDRIQYVLRHNADVVCETVDGDGNVFNVKYTGDFSVVPASGDENSNESVEESKPEKGVTQYGQHAPRFFIIHADGSGTELMRYQDVAEYLTSAEESPATAVMKDPLPDHPGVTGITILKPYIGGPADRWLKKYDLESIIPHGIRSRDLTTLPPKELKKEGPAFGTNIGQGLSVGAAVKSPARMQILKCPSVLELRQIVQYKPVTEALRNQLRGGLQDYAEYVMARTEASEDMQITDPRSEEERMLAADLQSAAILQKESRVIDPANIKELYENRTAPPVPSPPPTPQPKRSRADWERDQREVAEEIEGRNALRNCTIPSYFESELGKAFLLTQAKDMDQMMRELSEDPRRDGTEAIRGDTSSLDFPQETPVDQRGPGGQSTVRTSQQSDRSSGLASPYTYAQSTKYTMDTPSSHPGFHNDSTPSALRPGNPTPAHAAGQGSPAPLRPKNPTPAHAEKLFHDRPVNPTPKLAGGVNDSPSEPSHNPASEYPSIQEQPTEEEGQLMDFPPGDTDYILTPSLRTNVVGEPRKYHVPLPPAILGGRPGAKPNDRYHTVEDSVRRRVNNVVMTGATDKGKLRLQQMRGLNLLPEEVDFGVLREGNTYSYQVFLKNTGVDSCRFKIQQPPPATGLRIIYKPGPVAAGMKAELNLELYAIAVGVEGEDGVGAISHDLIIVSETDVLRLPIKATILTAHEYDSRDIESSPLRGMSPKTALVSTKPPATTGIIRPRRDQLAGRV